MLKFLCRRSDPEGTPAFQGLRAKPIQRRLFKQGHWFIKEDLNMNDTRAQGSLLSSLKLYGLSWPLFAAAFAVIIFTAYMGKLSLWEKAFGKITIGQKGYPKPSPAQSLKNGLVLISEDRRGKALITSLSVKQNIVLSTIDQNARFGIVDEKNETNHAEEKIRSLSIKTTGPAQQVAKLSGGNQQKVVCAEIGRASCRERV